MEEIPYFMIPLSKHGYVIYMPLLEKQSVYNLSLWHDYDKKIIKL